VSDFKELPTSLAGDSLMQMELSRSKRAVEEAKESVTETPLQRCGANSGACVVVSRMAHDDKTWLRKELDGIPYELFTEDLSVPTQSSLASLQDHSGFEHVKPKTKVGYSTRECGGFLSYLVHRYEDLPQASIFVQGQPFEAKRNVGQHTDWHSDPHIFSSIRSIFKEPDRVGYCSLNKRYWNKAEEDTPWYLTAWEQELNSSISVNPFSEIRRAVLSKLPAAGQGGVQCFCCGQFSVSRDRIRAHPKALYEELLDFVLDEPAENPWPTPPKYSNLQAKQWSNRCFLLEAVWHILFGEAAVCNLARSSCRAEFEGPATSETWANITAFGY